MKQIALDPLRRLGTWCARAGGLLTVLVLVKLTTAFSRQPSEKKLRTAATSPEAESRRATEERTMRALIGRLSEVEGVEHVLTRFSDRCVRPYNGSVLENSRSPYVLRCGMNAVAYFGVRGDITDVLPRIHAARIAAWGPRGGDGPGASTTAGTVAYALEYHRARGRYPDDRLMPAPPLRGPGLRIDWDRPDLPIPNLIEEPSPEPGTGPAEIYRRTSSVPRAPLTVAAARARYGTVLAFTLGGSWNSTAEDYFTVPRGFKAPRRGRPKGR
ncbi:hypothetical protein ACFVHB_15560 [Kitasatospora sp. NPDC127111]|uniref:hypothetical protein n=1 Tax=Kitasatospora sp. NPDC127111 TaxID=3345363 RepID=UPI003624D4DE